jgi:hypothetical protein
MPSFLGQFPRRDKKPAFGVIVVTVSALSNIPVQEHQPGANNILMAAGAASFAGGWCVDKLFSLGAGIEAGSVNLTMFIAGRLLACGCNNVPRA